jgi:type III pantothenate kinase
VTVLLVDAGNTRIKWARLNGTRLSKRQAAVHSGWGPAEYTRRLFRSTLPERVLVSSVAGPKVKEALGIAARRTGVGVHFVRTPRRAGGVTVGYLEPWRLGVDRFVAAVGAHQVFPGVAVCVVAVGTAMTIDLVDREGHHRGGVIIPSPRLMIDTLYARTYGIRRRARGGSPGEAGLIGRSTRAGVEQGSRYAAAALIDRLVEEAARAVVVRRPLFVLTGGEVDSVRPLVRSPCVVVPDLVLRGLAVLVQTPKPPRRR